MVFGIKQKQEELRQELNNNPWGLGYKVVMEKLCDKYLMPELEEDTATNIVNTLFLFLTQEERIDVARKADEVPPSFPEEVLLAKAGHAVVLKEIVMPRPELFVNMYNGCLMEGIFPRTMQKRAPGLNNERKRK